MTHKSSKIYDERETWERFWKREAFDFCRDYLYVVEGNLSYARGQYEDARMYYEKALKISPALRPALLNVIFAYAKLGEEDMHKTMVERLMQDKSLRPSSLYVIANSYILLGKAKESDTYYEELQKVSGWDRKCDYYRSTFCFENGLYEKALEFARRAYKLSPEDSSIRYHLSLCFNAVGEKDQALNMVKGLSEAPQWLNYYKFTLQRDSGYEQEASETLLTIPSDYFQDPDELEAAVDFARSRKDLVLLRHLRHK
jgi:tetratricopeptide (TPR) repeat protein